MCHNGTSSLFSRKTHSEKKGSNFSHAYPHLFIVQAGLWPALASTFMTKGFTGHDSITSGCLTHFRFPHLPVKISFYTGVSLHINKHREKGVRERKGTRTNTYLLNTYCQPRYFTHTGSFNLLNNL